MVVMTTETASPELDDHDRGLAFDLPALVQRRRVLQLLGGAGLVALVGCSSSNGSGGAATTAETSAATTAGTVTTTGAASTTAAAASTTTGPVEVIPEETAGPFPANGSNGVDVLSESGIVRRDIRPSFGSSTTVAEGVPTTMTFTVVDAATGAALPGAAVYLWHCDRDGDYSMYSPAAKDENYLRGVQEADASGALSFQTIYPGCYSGRWPHMHFEVYPSVAEATSAASKLATSQVALPEDVSDAVYASPGYERSAPEMARLSLATDGVFRDGAELETPTVTGSVGDGYTLTLTVGVNA